MLLAVKPCSGGEANPARHAELQGRTAALGAEVVAWVERAAPQACAIAPAP
jgi:hypothetical protein